MGGRGRDRGRNPQSRAPRSPGGCWWAPPAPLSAARCRGRGRGAVRPAAGVGNHPPGRGLRIPPGGCLGEKVPVRGLPRGCGEEAGCSGWKPRAPRSHLLWAWRRGTRSVLGAVEAKPPRRAPRARPATSLRLQTQPSPLSPDMQNLNSKEKKKKKNKHHHSFKLRQCEILRQRLFVRVKCAQTRTC